MADETQDSQKEALKKNELPEGTQTDLTPVEEYQRENEQVKDKLAEFGETDLEQFIVKMTSNTLYARMAVRKLLGLDGDKQVQNLEHRTSPQENNITGSLIRTQHPPLIKGGPSGATDETVK